MVRTQIQLTEEQARKLKRLSAQKHEPVSKIIRKAVNSLLKSTTAIEEDEKRKKAISAAGSLHSGLGDLSKAHDKYLTESYK